MTQKSPSLKKSIYSLHLLDKIKSGGLHCLDVLYKAAYRFYCDDCFSRASGLSYTTLFAIVPVMAIFILFFTAAGVNEKEVEENITSVITKILPSNTVADLKLDDGFLSVDNVANEQLVKLRDEVVATLLTLAGHARTLGIITIVTLFFICISLLNTIESAMNAIWRANTANIRFFQKVLNFWAVLTMTPVLLAASIYVTNSFGILNIDTFGNYKNLQIFLSFSVPVLITTLALAFLFFKLPATQVRFRDACLGGFVAAVLFEMVKIGFSYYLMKSTNYAAIYGVLATIPLFLLWMYLAWVVILYGAEVANLSGSLILIKEIGRYSSSLGEVGPVLGLRIMLLYAQLFTQGGKPLTESDLSAQTGVDPVIIRNSVELLTTAGLLTSTGEERKGRTINRALNLISVRDIVNAFLNRPDASDHDFKILNLVGKDVTVTVKNVTLAELV